MSKEKTDAKPGKKPPLTNVRNTATTLRAPSIVESQAEIPEEIPSQEWTNQEIFDVNPETEFHLPQEEVASEDSNLELNHVIVNPRINTTLPSIELIDAYKHYGPYNCWNYVLDGCNLKANCGDIYAILGPGKSGKSTILNILVGLSNLTKGKVQIFGYKPDSRGSRIPGLRIGYTPQHSGIHGYFSIDEAFRYNGKLLELEHSYINGRIAFLYELLHLPKDSKRIKMYDDNVKRRISFGLAILHEPELLILDEPTYGINPDIGQSIWKHLLHLSGDENKTVILTTNSASEANYCHRVGIIADGKIILEGNPKFIVNRNNEKDLRQVYFQMFNPYSLDIQKLSKRIRRESTTKLPENFRSSPSGGFEIVLPTNDSRRATITSLHLDKYPKCDRKRDSLQPKSLTGCCKFRPRKIGLVTAANYLLVARNASVWFWWIFLSHILLLLVFVASGAKTANGLKLAVWNDETSNCTDSKLISCMVVYNLVKISPINVSTSIHSLGDLDHVGTVDAMMHFPLNLTTYLKAAMKKIGIHRVILDVHDVSINVTFFCFNILDQYLIMKYIQLAFSKVVQEGSLLTNEFNFDYPLKFKQADGQHLDLGFQRRNSEYVGPGLLLLSTVYLSTTCAAFIYVWGRSRNLISVYHVLGINKLELVASYFCCFVPLIMMHALFCLSLLYYCVGNIAVRGSFAVIIRSLLISIVKASLIGLFIGQVARSPLAVAAAAIYWQILITFTLTASNYNERAPWYAKMLRYFPHRSTLNSLRTATLHSMNYHNLYFTWPKAAFVPLAYIFGFGILCIILGLKLPH